MELCPLIFSKIAVYFSWKRDHTCSMNTFFHIFFKGHFHGHFNIKEIIYNIWLFVRLSKLKFRYIVLSLLESWYKYRLIWNNLLWMIYRYRFQILWFVRSTTRCCMCWSWYYYNQLVSTAVPNYYCFMNFVMVLSLYKLNLMLNSYT